MVFVKRDGSNNITGVFPNENPQATESISRNDPDVVAFFAKDRSIKSQTVELAGILVTKGILTTDDLPNRLK